MKKANFKQEEIPALVGRGGAEVKDVDRNELKTSGTPFSGSGMAKGDVVEFPDTWDDVEVKKIQVRPNSNSWDYRILVLKNSRPNWLSIGYLCRTDKDRKAVHPVAEMLTKLHDNEEKIDALLGKTIVAGDVVEYQRQSFDADGRIQAGIFETVTTPKLEIKA